MEEAATKFVLESDDWNHVLYINSDGKNLAPTFKVNDAIKLYPSSSNAFVLGELYPLVKQKDISCSYGVVLKNSNIPCIFYELEHDLLVWDGIGYFYRFKKTTGLAVEYLLAQVDSRVFRIKDVLAFNGVGARRLPSAFNIGDEFEIENFLLTAKWDDTTCQYKRTIASPKEVVTSCLGSKSKDLCVAVTVLILPNVDPFVFDGRGNVYEVLELTKKGTKTRKAVRRKK
jgi:hypothetical protein